MRGGFVLTMGLAAILAWVAWKKHHREYPPVREDYFVVPSYKNTLPPGIGNMQGVKFLIPAWYMHHRIGYLGESHFAPTKKPRSQRTFEDKIESINVLAHFPDMKHLLPENRDSYHRAEQLHTESDWVKINYHMYEPWRDGGVNVYGFKMLPEKPERNGLANVVTSRLSEDYFMRRNLDARFEKKGLDQGLGLHMAVTVGPGDEKFHIWNERMYWDGDEGHNVSTLILCTNGAKYKANLAHTCSHMFNAPTMDAKYQIWYSMNLLVHWKQIEQKTHELIMSFRVLDTPTDQESTP